VGNLDGAELEEWRDSLTCYIVGPAGGADGVEALFKGAAGAEALGVCGRAAGGSDVLEERGLLLRFASGLWVW
jgi:hypothetical protein